MDNLNYIIVFIEGLLSFLSPCVIPILPIYLAILSSSHNTHQQEATLDRKVLVINTLLFVLGISTTFFILGTGLGIFRTFLGEYKRFLLMGGGAFIMIMGLFYIGDLKISFLQRERRIHYKAKQMNPFIAYLLGFTFSFGWTPCIGPMLASVLVLASTSQNALTGNILIGVYTLGFIIPFMIVAIFSEKMLKFLDKVKLQYGRLQKVGGYILILMGFLVFINGARTPQFKKPDTAQAVGKTAGQSDQVLAPDFVLEDQYGNIHKLSDYKGKTVFLNFWATWCPPCQAEMPHIEDIYKEYGMNEEDVIILGVAFPNMGGEKSKEEIKAFLNKHEYTFPVIFNEEMDLSYYYNISVFPTTYIINSEGNIEGYLQGAMKKEDMKNIIERVRE